MYGKAAFRSESFMKKEKMASSRTQEAVTYLMLDKHCVGIHGEGWASDAWDCKHDRPAPCLCLSHGKSLGSESEAYMPISQINKILKCNFFKFEKQSYI